MISVECFPYVKVGGLGDVVPALSRELDKLGHSIAIVIPAFQSIDFAYWGFTLVDIAPGSGSDSGFAPGTVHRATLPSTNVDVYAVGGEGYFDREGVYVDSRTHTEYEDQLERWVYFQLAALWVLARTRPDLDVIHLHDYHTGFVPQYLEKYFRSDAVFRSTATVATIHNLAYQGSFEGARWPVTRLDGSLTHESSAEFYGSINLLKAAIVDSDFLTTVSPTYSREIQTPEFGLGLEGVARERAGSMFGILNGVDTEVWNPATDTLIAAPYSVDSLEGKATNRARLLDEFGFDPALHDGPFIGMISRIERQKGFDILLPVLDELLARDVFLVILGRGIREIEQETESVVARHPERMAARFGSDEGLAHRIEAGADMFLMPSRYEPCGLNQMYSQAYGTVPIVRATGGLADTVVEFDPESGKGTGFLFSSTNPRDLLATVDRALEVWKEPALWRRVQANGMRCDFTWERSARDYIKVYRRAIAARAGESRQAAK
jgi:starch synthase